MPYLRSLLTYLYYTVRFFVHIYALFYFLIKFLFYAEKVTSHIPNSKSIYQKKKKKNTALVIFFFIGRNFPPSSFSLGKKWKERSTEQTWRN